MALKFKDFLQTEYQTEVLSRSARIKMGRTLKKNKAKIQRGRKIAAKRMASPEKLKQRARKGARAAIFKKLSKDVPKNDMAFSRRAEIDKRLETPMMKKKIDRLSVKLLKDVRKKEMERKKS